MEKCYEYLGCSKTNCVMYGCKDNVACWDVEGTLCNNPGMEVLATSNKDKCRYCIYYEAMKDSGNKLKIVNESFLY
jgi:hypothetical protein